MVRPPRPLRVLSSILALVAPLLFGAESAAAPAKTKSDAATTTTAAPKKKSSKKKKAVADKSEKNEKSKSSDASSKKKLPPLPDKDKDKDESATGSKGDAKSAKKEEVSEDPPVELTGALPEAKYVDAKPKKKKTNDAKADDAKTSDAKKSVSAKTDKSDDKKKKKDGGDKKDDAKAEPTPRPETPFDLGGSLPEAKKPKVKTCLNPAVTFARLGQPTDVSFVLTTCKGKIAPGAVEYLSVLGRPYDLPPPKWMGSMTKDGEIGVLSQEIATEAMKTFEKTAKAKKKKGETEEVSPGIRRLDPGLVLRLQAIAAHFPGKTITLVSGYRPQSKGSPHSFGRAFDMRIDGVTNETLVAFCKTLKDTGCGYYPNSYFVHVDVRPAGAGHVYWIDVSGPGEKPVYVKQWPLAPKLPPLPEPADPETGKPVPATTDESTIGDVDEAPAAKDSDATPTMPMP